MNANLNNDIRLQILMIRARLAANSIVEADNVADKLVAALTTISLQSEVIALLCSDK